jgi:hypothetical protein
MLAILCAILCGAILYKVAWEANPLVISTGAKKHFSFASENSPKPGQYTNFNQPWP